MPGLPINLIRPMAIALSLWGDSADNTIDAGLRELYPDQSALA